MKNYYEILAISSDASLEAVKKSYRQLSKQYHPDLNPNDKIAAAKFIEIGEAYSVLSNPVTRREYDAKLHSVAAAKKKEPPPKQQNFPKEFTAGDVSRRFEQYFGFNPHSTIKNPKKR